MTSFRTARVAPEKAVFRPALPMRSMPGLYGADMPRKVISKRVRFEVFKRDNFKCQYCGSEAPRVVLHVDHINPASKRAARAGVGIDDIEYEAKTARNWTQFNQWLQAAISEAEGQ